MSNKGIQAIRRSLGQNGLISFIDLVIGDQLGLPKKPDAALLNDHILKAYPDFQKERILMVGDTEVDIQFAKNAEISSCWVSYGYGDTERCQELMPEHQLKSFDELAALVGTPAGTKVSAGRPSSAA